MEKAAKYMKIAIPLSLVYVAVTFFLEDQLLSLLKSHTPLMWGTMAVAVANFGLLLACLFTGGATGFSVILLNLAQLAIFCQLHIQIHAILGAAHYSATSPSLLDWMKFVGLHTLKAIDVLDVIEAFSLFETGHVSHQSIPAGIALFAMQLTVGLFVAGLVFKAVSRRSQKQEPLSLTKWIRVGALAAGLAAMAVFGWKDNWGAMTWVLWPADNVLLTLDVGDGLQIFGWQLEPMKMDRGLAGVAVFFRVVIAWYAIVLAYALYLRVTKKRHSVDDLAIICVSSEHPAEERILAIRTLEELGTFADAAVPQLVNALADSNEDIRNAAAEALEEIDPHWAESDAARGAMHDLIKSLLNKDKSTRDAAAEALKKIDPQWPQHESARNAIPNLVNALFEKDKAVRIAGAEALGKIGSTAEKAVPHLVKILSDSDKEVRKASANALGSMGPAAEEAISPLIKALEDDTIRNTSAEALGKIGPEAIPQLMDTLGNNDENIRNSAAKALEVIDPGWREIETVHEIAENFVNVLKDSFSSARSGAGAALGIIGRADAVPHLVNVLADGEESVRDTAEEALEKIDPQWHQTHAAREVFPHLVSALIDIDPGVRKAAADALGRIDPRWQQSDIARKAIPQFVKALKNALHTVRMAACDALGELGPAAAKAIPYLVRTLADKEADVRGAVKQALERIDTNWYQNKSALQVIPNFIKALKEKDWRVRNSAAAALGEIGPASATVVPMLAKLMTDSDKRVRTTVIGSLEKIDPKWRDSKGIHKVVPYFIKALGDPQQIIRVSAVEAMAEIGPSIAKTASPYIARALKDSVIDVQNAATHALETLDPTGKLREQEVAEGGYVPSAADKTLGEIDPASAEAIPHLVKKLIDSDISVRRTAREELEKIDPKWAQTQVARSLIPFLVKEGLADSRWIVRSSAAEALGEFGPGASKVAPRLVKAMGMDSSVDVQCAARKALKKIGVKI